MKIKAGDYCIVKTRINNIGIAKILKIKDPNTNFKYIFNFYQHGRISFDNSCPENRLKLIISID